MSQLVRFGVSIAEDLLDKFDAVIRARNYPTRSKAIEDFVRQTIVESKISKDTAEVVGSIDIVYDHHKRELLNKLTDIQHDFHDIILSSQHIHLDRHNCFEIIIVRGKKNIIEKLANLIKSAKGVKHSAMRIVTTQGGD
ncbi:MAG: nickel-responsive transcriptional regulator NikR [Endomicrobiia bacterium]|nr:nickel-responsive transcriptional regulator NikR [Endomicrobiia bacterium]